MRLRRPGEVFVLWLLALGPALRAQREVPAPRTGFFAGHHLAYGPHQYRGANLWISTSRSAAQLWNQWPANRDAVACFLAHAAAQGVNVVRVFLDYKSFLWSRLYEAPGDPDAYGRKVRALCELAAEYEIGVIPVLFTAFGSDPSGFLHHGGEAPGPTTIAPTPGCLGYADVLCTEPDPARGAAPGRRSCLRICLSPTDGTGCVPEIQRTPDWLFEDPAWREDPGVRHGMVDYVASVLRAIGRAPAVLQVQAFNEPDFLLTRIPAGQVVAAVVSLLAPPPRGTLNPDALPLSISATSFLQFGDHPGGLCARGFPPALFRDLVGYGTHVWPDTWVAKAGRPLLQDGAAQHRWFVRRADDPRDPGPSLQADHRRAFGLAVGPHAAFSDAAGARHVSLQMLNDLVLQNASFDSPSRDQGLLLWTLFPSEVAGGEGGCIALPGGTVLSWRESMALQGRWRHGEREPDPPRRPTGVTGDRVDQGFSDALLPLLLTAPAAAGTDTIALAVYAENFDDQPEHGDPLPAARRHAERNSIFARAARVPVAGSVVFGPRATVTGGPGAGPLRFDADRDALNPFNARSQTTDPAWPGPAHPEVEGAGLRPFLRGDLLMRQKLRDQPEALRPVGAYAGRNGQRHVFWIAYSRPVARSQDPDREPCLPWDDAARWPAGVAYFSPFARHDATGESWKYEVLLRRVELDEATSPPAVTLGAEEVLRTRGVRGERWVGDKPAGTGITRPDRAEDAGAAAVDPRLVASPAGDLLVLYRKSQDSWFDVPLEYPGGVDRAFEAAGQWHVYPWEVFAQIRDGRTGQWLRAPGAAADAPPWELRVSRAWPSGGEDPLADWQQSVKTQVVFRDPAGVPKNGPVQRRLRLIDFFPAVEPAGAVWRDAHGVLQAQAVFHQLCTWIDTPAGTGHPAGYGPMASRFVAGVGFAPPRALLPRPDPERAGVAREHRHAQGEPRLLASPGTPDGLAWLQQGQELHLVTGAATALAVLPVSRASTGQPLWFLADRALAEDGAGTTACLALTAVDGSLALTGILVRRGSAGPAAVLWQDRSGEVADPGSRFAALAATGPGRFLVVWHGRGRVRSARLHATADGLRLEAPQEILRCRTAAETTRGLLATATAHGVLLAWRGELWFLRP